MMEDIALDTGGAENAYRDLALSQGSLSSVGDMRPLGGVQTTQRGFNSVLASANALGIEIDKTNPIMRGILSALITAEVSGNVVQAAKAIVKIYHAREAAEAVALTAANGWNPVGWGKIAVAAGAAIMVGAAFGVGFHLGSGHEPSPVSSSTQTVSVDISNPVARRAAMRGMR